MEPLITTVIPTYCRAELLKRAINSVLNQTYPNFQVCVYDNASEDNTAEVVAKISNEDPRVKYYCHHKNIGSISNFNYGIQKLNTPFFSLLSDDNVLLPNFYQDAINTLNRYPNAFFFAGQTISVNEKNKISSISLKDWQTGMINPPNGLFYIWEKGLPTWDGVLFRTEVIKTIGGLNPDVHGSADQDFIMRICRKFPFYVAKTPCARFTFHSNSQTIRRDLDEIVKSQRKILDQWLNDDGLNHVDKKRLIKGYKAFIKEKITTYLYYKAIVGKERNSIATAAKLMKKETGLSIKTIIAIATAKIVNLNDFFKRSLPIFIKQYFKCREKYISYKLNKIYSGN